MSRRIVVSTFAALCLLALGLMVPSRTVHGQTFRGAILGTVNDSSEAPVPGTQVTVKNLGTGMTRTTMTDDSGQYRYSGYSAARC